MSAISGLEDKLYKAETKIKEITEAKNT